MARTRRTGANRQERPTGSVLGASTTPPSHTSQLQPDESSLRSTVAPRSNPQPKPFLPRTMAPPPPPSTPAQSRMSIQNLINPSTATEEQSGFRPAMFTPINSPAKFETPRDFSVWTPAATPAGRHRPWKPSTDSELFTHHLGHRRPSGFQVDMNEYHSPQLEDRGILYFKNAESLRIDREDGRVWHMGHTVGEAYSGTFVNDRSDSIPWQAQKKIRQMKEERENPQRVQECAQLLSYCRRMLDAGALLVLQRTSFVEYGEPVPCCCSFCPLALAIAADSYYLSLEWGDCLYTFCLHCFEQLWDGKFTEHIYVGDPSIRQPKRRDSAISVVPVEPAAPAYSPITPPRGAFTDPIADIHLAPSNDIYKSKHAEPSGYVPPPTGFVSPVYEPSIHQPGQEPEAWDSPSSQTSTGEWRHPPTRFQHIASFVMIGGALSDVDKAVLALWKETSRDQLEWELHLRKTKYTRDYYDGRAEKDLSMSVPPLRVGQAWDTKYAGDVAPLEKKTGLKKKECYGRDLSEVLREVAVKMKEKSGTK